MREKERRTISYFENFPGNMTKIYWGDKELENIVYRK